jgi:hypothetical protein
MVSIPTTAPIAAIVLARIVLVGHVQGSEHLRREGENGEVGRDVAGVEDAHEDRPTADPGREQLPQAARGDLPVLALDLLLAEVRLAAEVAVGHGPGLVDPPAAHEPARRLRQPDPRHQRHQGGDDAGRQHPPPRHAGEVDEGERHDHRDEIAHVPGDQQPRDAPPAPGRRRELREQRRPERVLGTDGDAEQEPHGEELPGLGDHRLQQAEHHEAADVDGEQGPSADPVREPPH